MACLSGTSGGAAYEAPMTSHLTGISYHFPVDKITFDLLPNDYREIMLYTYIMCINLQIELLHKQFLKYREISLLEMNINPSSIVLEKWLNIKYNTDEICIVNKSSVIDDTYLYRIDEIGDSGDSNYWFNEDEAIEATDNTYLYNMTESDFDADFKVKFPQDLIDSGHTIQELRSHLDKYTAVGYSYIIDII